MTDTVTDAPEVLAAVERVRVAKDALDRASADVEAADQAMRAAATRQRVADDELTSALSTLRCIAMRTERF